MSEHWKDKIQINSQVNIEVTLNDLKLYAHLQENQASKIRVHLHHINKSNPSKTYNLGQNLNHIS